jgi:hypothetical protein
VDFGSSFGGSRRGVVGEETVISVFKNSSSPRQIPAGDYFLGMPAIWRDFTSFLYTYSRQNKRDNLVLGPIDFYHGRNVMFHPE